MSKTGTLKNTLSLKKLQNLLGMVARTYNPSYSGSKDQKKHSSKSAQEKCYQDKQAGCGGLYLWSQLHTSRKYK
jgi:hypothetical protein